VRLDLAGTMVRALAPASVRPAPGERVAVKVVKAALFR